MELRNIQIPHGTSTSPVYNIMELRQHTTVLDPDTANTAISTMLLLSSHRQVIIVYRLSSAGSTLPKLQARWQISFLAQLGTRMTSTVHICSLIRPHSLMTLLLFCLFCPLGHLPP